MRAQRADENSWRILQLRNGVGRIEAATVEEFIPQMLNYDLTGHINFNKGCYTGQEVIVRIRDRGHVNRHLRQLELGDMPTPARGTELLAADGISADVIDMRSLRPIDSHAILASVARTYQNRA